ncbi:MAG: LysM peptidoglycan-binding domain-containing protein [Chloroflexi bacterium]|nr:LysM peptidoglycan-binding domain-containing protein [Chloroflexota bacterium]
MKDDTVRIGEELTIPLPTPTPTGGAQLPQLPSNLGAAQLSLSTPTLLALQSPPTAAPATPPGLVRHTVARGDTLSSIAAIYGSNVDSIRIANQLSGDMLSIGQVLQVPVGAWEPTPAPVAAISPTATPTSQFAYTAPSLQWPPDNQVFQGSGGAPTLEWQSVAMLKAGESYVVRIDYAVNGVSKPPITAVVKQGTSYRIDPATYPGPNASGTEFKWYVVVVSQNSAAVSPQARASVSSPGIAVSPPSETRRFVWY